MDHEFAMFWSSRTITAYEKACMASFIRHGSKLTVYSYDTVAEAPAGVVQESAAAIVDERMMAAFLIDGIPSLSHFSDLFRYRLFQRTAHIYVDADMYLLRPIGIELPRSVLAKESATSLCGAILRVDAREPALGKLVERTEASAGRELVWGETGPQLLTELLARTGRADAFEPKFFFPFNHNEFWKVFLPEHRQECEDRCGDSYTLHLWNNVITRMGIWKQVLPPAGSFLERRFVEDGAGSYFQGTFPANEMRQVIDNFRNRVHGNLGDLKRAAKVLLHRRSTQRRRRTLGFPPRVS